MKKKIIGISVVLVVAMATVINARMVGTKLKNTDLLMENIEALAQDETTEKKYDYIVWELDECHVYVGGAYAKGKKVSCTDGSKHPVCVECQL